MIFEGVLDTVFGMINLIIDLFPNSIPSIAFSLGVIVEPLQYACYYFGADNLALVLSHVILWSYTYLGWSIIEWIYHKIPGIT